MSDNHPHKTGTISGSPGPNAAATQATGPPASGAGGGKKINQLGDFKIVRKLGQGGMGEVFLAHQISLDRDVALKTLSKELAKKEDFVKRFQREARAMARLDHNNAVKVFAVDSIQGIHFAAIEYIDGQSMQAWMDQLGKLSVGDALHIIIACADALKLAHDQTMIHRDIKPDNILVTKKGVVKLSDFGLAKARDDEDVSMTQSGTGLGTPLYMAPEQARNAKHVDLRTDIYALGSTLYYFLTGTLPFQGESTLELILAKEQGRFINARKLNPQVPDRLDLMIDKMIAKEPKNRYQDCAALIADLESLRLHSLSLSFIDHPEKAVLGRATASQSSMATINVPAPASNPVPPSRPAQVPSAPATVHQRPSFDPEKMWYVQYPDVAGRIKKSRLSSDQIKKALRKGMLDSRAKAKASSAAEYLPLSYFPEFETLIQGLVTKSKADRRSQDMQAMYEAIDRQERNRKRFRWFRNFMDGIQGGIGFIIWLTMIGAVLFIAWKWGWPMLRDMLNSAAGS